MDFSSEAPEIAIGRVQDSAVFQCQCGQVSVADQRPRGLSLDDHLSKERPMTISRHQHPHIRLF